MDINGVKGKSKADITKRISETRSVENYLSEFDSKFKARHVKTPAK